ncbi:MAG: hypothetical protein K8R36_01735 [Planctomycetales bacterium]|nr:hypothetical protein [Planctomycetales bacterium]
MKIKYLMPTLLFLAPLALCGCLSRSEASPSSSPVGATPAVTAVPTVLIPEPEPLTSAVPKVIVPKREPLTPLEVALGLDYEVSAEKMKEIAARIRKEGKYCGQGCGISGITEDGKAHGAFWDCFVIKNAGGEEAGAVSLGYLQNDVGFYSLDGDGFVYQLRKGIFYRESRPKRK